MRKTSKVLCLLIAAALMFALAACGRQGGQENTGAKDTGASEQSQATEAAKKENVNLRFMWWGGDSRHKATLDAINAYTALNPNVRIEAEYQGYEGYREKIITQLAGGTAADIMQLDTLWLNNLNQQGEMFVNLYDKKELIHFDAFDAQTLEDHASIDNKLQGLPTGFAGMTMVINKGFFAQHGIPADTVWNWDNMLEIGKKVHAENKNHYLLGSAMSSYLLEAYVAQKTGKVLLQGDYTLGFDANIMTEALAYFKSLYDGGVVQPIAETVLFKAKEGENPKWINGEIGMTGTWSSSISTFKKENLDLDIARFPLLNEQVEETKIVVVPSQLLSIAKKSKNIDEGVKFIDWLLTDKEAISVLGEVRGTQPTEMGRKTLMDSGKSDMLVVKALETAMKFSGSPRNAVEVDQQNMDILNDTFEKVAFGKLTPEQGTAEMMKLLEDRLKEMKSN